MRDSNPHISTFPTDPPKQERVRATREHSTPPSSPLPGGYTLLSPSLHSQCASSLSHNGIAEVGLTGACGQYYKVPNHGGLQRTVLNQHSRKHYIGTPFPMQVTRPVSDYISFLIITKLRHHIHFETFRFKSLSQ